jgi:hypothetical protein
VKTYRCAEGHTHGTARGSKNRKDGDPCQLRRTKAKNVGVRELMSQGERREEPARISGVVHGGLPGHGKRR